MRRFGSLLATLFTVLGCAVGLSVGITPADAPAEDRAGVAIVAGTVEDPDSDVSQHGLDSPEHFSGAGRECSASCEAQPFNETRAGLIRTRPQNSVSQPWRESNPLAGPRSSDLTHLSGNAFSSGQAGAGASWPKGSIA